MRRLSKDRTARDAAWADCNYLCICTPRVRPFSLLTWRVICVSCVTDLRESLVLLLLLFLTLDGLFGSYPKWTVLAVASFVNLASILINIEYLFIGNPVCEISFGYAMPCGYTHLTEEGLDKNKDNFKLISSSRSLGVQPHRGVGDKDQLCLMRWTVFTYWLRPCSTTALNLLHTELLFVEAPGITGDMERVVFYRWKTSSLGGLGWIAH